MKTELNDRTLWHDGTNQVNPDQVPELVLAGAPIEKIVVKELNRDIELYNSLTDDPVVSIKNANEPFNYSWNIPTEYQNLDLAKFVHDALLQRGWLKDKRYMDRACEEALKIHEYRLEPLFKTLIYIVDTLKKEKKVWGVGRGSSCASLILHLIGIHEVDPIKFNIPLDEFFHD